MKQDQELLLINEIKNIEQQLYQKQSELTSYRHMNNAKDLGTDTEAWKKEFSDIIKNIEKLSSGGNSVEDVNKERQ